MATILLPTRQVPRRPAFGLPRLNHRSWQSWGLVFWEPGLAKPLRDFSDQRWPISELSDNVLLAPHPNPGGAVWEAESGAGGLAVVDNSADGALDFGLADPVTFVFTVDLHDTGGTLLSKAGATGSQRQYQLFHSSDPAEYFAGFHGTNSSSNLSLIDRGPTTVVTSKSGAQEADDVSIYFDGELVATGTAGTDPTNNADVLIGARRGTDSNSGVGFTINAGEQIWNIRIYNYEFSAAQAREVSVNPDELLEQEPRYLALSAGAAISDYRFRQRIAA